MPENIIRTKSYAFAVQIINLTRELRNRKIETSIITQLLRSGTSISANVEEAVGAISRREFSSKISICYKETRETLNWLKLLNDTGGLTPEEFNTAYLDCDELARILYAILRKTRISNDQGT